MKRLCFLICLLPALAFAQARPEVEWLPISVGQFEMGSPKQSKIKRKDEKPHHVEIRNEFSADSLYLKFGKYEVTFDQFDAFCEATGRAKPADNGWGRGNRPVINVNWADASEFAEWMGARLPTEAEWEYVCRAGADSFQFSSSDTLTLAQANISGCYPRSCTKDPLLVPQTLPVGSFPSNPWGLADMQGNVWEWCSDWYADYKKGSQSNPTGPRKGSMKVIRGGAYNTNARMCRCAYRGHISPKARKSNLGFRIVKIND